MGNREEGDNAERERERERKVEGVDNMFPLLRCTESIHTATNMDLMEPHVHGSSVNIRRESELFT